MAFANLMPMFCMSSRKDLVRETALSNAVFPRAALASVSFDGRTHEGHTSIQSGLWQA